MKPQDKQPFRAMMNVRRHRRSNIQNQQAARASTRLQHLARNRLAMRPRLRLQDLGPRDLRPRNLRLRDRRLRKTARRVSHQARSLPMTPNLKLGEMNTFEDGWKNWLEELLSLSFMLRFRWHKTVSLTVFGPYFYKLL